PPRGAALRPRRGAAPAPRRLRHRPGLARRGAVAPGAGGAGALRPRRGTPPGVVAVVAAVLVAADGGGGGGAVGAGTCHVRPRGGARGGRGLAHPRRRPRHGRRPPRPGGAPRHRPPRHRPPPPYLPRHHAALNTTATAVPVRSGDDTANAHPLTDAERAVLRRFVDLGLAHPVAVLTRLHIRTVVRASEGGAMTPRAADALRRFLDLPIAQT